MNRTDRLVAMVLHLQGRRVVRAEELAAHFEVNIRTIYRDIAALGEAGVPIAGEAGVGYSLLKGYQLPPVMFTAEEASSLFVGGELVKQFTDASLHAPMASALDKLRAVLPRDRQDHVARLVENTIVYGRQGGADPEAADQRWLMPVQQGVVLRRVLRLTYRGRGQEAETQRDVEPLGVVFYGGRWYLVAWCRLRKDYRHFRVDRIRRLELAPMVFAPRPEFSLAEHMRAFTRREETLPVRVWFRRCVLERARRESYATLIEESARDDGGVYSLYAWSLEWMAQWLLSFGEHAEALGPAKLRELVASAAEQTARRYAKKDRRLALPAGVD
ncbi:MAG: YafY family transcriptional regulator [Opitutae bacterium]|nr:YafY family transcriptional regulator [Opitutae bacterium]